ncbi:MAG TPA: hypothetical protein VHB70_06015 [Parafilimonas sp.]|nr:hypothetical protein [Parafilimonas sp.]
MQLEELKQSLISEFKNLNDNKILKRNDDLTDNLWLDIKIKEQHTLNKIKASSKAFKIIAYVLSAITGFVALLKFFGNYSWIDLNKASLLILLTVTNAVTAFSTSMQLTKLEKKVLILDILSKFPV